MLTIHLTAEEAESLVNLLKQAGIPMLERHIDILTGIADDNVVILQAELDRRRAVLAKLEAGGAGA